MDLADCYRLLGITSEASVAEIKSSYRRLARQYHPDVNPSDRQAQDKFIAATEAYQFLLKELDRVTVAQTLSTPPFPTAPTTEVTRKPKPTPPQPPLTETEQLLKRQSYLHLQQLLKEQRFPRAIALVEGLAQRIPQDLEVRQWQAIAYSRWGRYWVNEKQFNKARSYLKKALRTDPHNKSLWAEVEHEFRRIEQKL
ncbi:MAG: DnaJ domain-containing protein [Kastovskya adunca ATA6-11-RM4]|jgi:curved DNA-binding protein CbpA|nr:DnaJ domain-containing protein [Kastovskya adunca ATA6-11-RM4]